MREGTTAMGCLKLPHILRVVEIVLCALAVVLPMIKRLGAHPYNVWCEFVWTFSLIVATVILVVELLKLDLVLGIILQHSWDDLATGLTLLCSFMLLTASIIFPVRVMQCTVCFVEIITCIVSFAATVVFLVDGVRAKMKIMSGGYLSAVCGVLRFTEALCACIMFAAYASYFLGVSSYQIPAAMGWCMVVYIVCFVASVLMILFNLVKLLKALLCVDKIEVIVNVIAVVLYITAMILWPIYGKRHYYTYNKWDYDGRSTSNYGYRYRDLMVVLAFTALNLILYIVDMILSLLALHKRI